MVSKDIVVLDQKIFSSTPMNGCGAGSVIRLGNSHQLLFDKSAKKGDLVFILPNGFCVFQRNRGGLYRVIPIQLPCLDDIFRLSRTPGRRPCAAQHHQAIACMIPAKHDCQGHACQSEVPGTTSPNLAVGTSQTLSRRQQRC